MQHEALKMSAWQHDETEASDADEAGGQRDETEESDEEEAGDKKEHQSSDEEGHEA